MSINLKKVNSWLEKEDKKQTKSEKLKGFIVLIVIFFIIKGLFFGGSSDKDVAETPKSNETETEIVETTAEPSQIPQKELSLTDKLVILSKDKIDEDVVLEFEEQERFILATISDHDYTFWDETDMANSVWKFFVPFAREAFDYDEVNRIKIAITSEFVDSHGNESTHNAVYIDMDKRDFNEFNWDNLKFTNPKNNQELIDKTNYFIHGLIYPKVKTDKLKLSYL